MKQSNKNRPMGRHNNNRFGNNNRHLGNTVTRNTVFDSSSVAGRVRGTSQQLVDKYLSLAKDAKAEDDRVMYETYMQYADHYTRMLDIAIQSEQARVAAIAAQQQAQRMVAEQQAMQEKVDEQPQQENTPIENSSMAEPDKKTKHIKIRSKKVQDSREALVVEDSLKLSSEKTDVSDTSEISAPQPVVIEIPE